MDAATALASVRVVLGHSDGINDAASVVTVWIVPNFPYVPELHIFPMPASSRLEDVVMSVRLLDAIDWFVVKSAMGVCMDCLRMGIALNWVTLPLWLCSNEGPK